MPRLFAGLELPEEVVDLIGDLEQPVPGARWIAMDDLHVTLRFFGDVTRSVAHDLIDSLAAIGNIIRTNDQLIISISTGQLVLSTTVVASVDHIISGTAVENIPPLAAGDLVISITTINEARVV